MSGRNSRKSSTRRSSIPLYVISRIPDLVIRGGWAYLKFKSVRKKGVKRFRKELKKSGMTKEQIDALTLEYEDIGRFRSYIEGIGFRSIFGRI